MKRNTLLLSILVLALLLAACGTTINSITTIQGSGDVVTVERDVSGFSSIQINLGADLILTQGDSESLTIEADDNLMQYIETEVQNGRLIVSTPDNTSIVSNNTIRLNVAFETLREIEIFGSSNITAADLNLDGLTITFSGSGSTRFSGTVDEQIITIRGMAIINNADLISRRVTIDVSGNGTLNVHAEDTLDITVSGMGTVRYTGDPTITQNSSGSVSVVQVQE